MVMELVKVAFGYREEFGKGSGLCSKSTSLYHPARGSVKRVLNWWTIRAATCRRPDGHCLVHGGTAIEGGSHGSQGGEKSPTYEHVKYKNSSICRDSGPVVDVWKGPLCCLSCRN